MNQLPVSIGVIKIALLLTGLIALFLISLVNTPNKIMLAAQQKCSSGWYITGYFTPRDSDYNGSKQIVKVIAPNSTVQNRIFFSSFLRDVEVEGWGKTPQGDYVGLVTNDKQWHSASKPIGGMDQPLQPHSVAVDPKMIRLGQQLSIPTLPKPWNTITFTSADVGPDIKGKHIDVYTGEGMEAGKETFTITGHHNQVCLM